MLSSTTAESDRTTKFKNYEAFDSIKTYVLIESLHYGVQVLDRSRDGQWRIDDVTDPDGIICIPSIDIELPMAELYRDVDVLVHED